MATSKRRRHHHGCLFSAMLSVAQVAGPACASSGQGLWLRCERCARLALNAMSPLVLRGGGLEDLDGDSEFTSLGSEQQHATTSQQWYEIHMRVNQNRNNAAAGSSRTRPASSHQRCLPRHALPRSCSLQVGTWTGAQAARPYDGKHDGVGGAGALLRRRGHVVRHRDKQLRNRHRGDGTRGGCSVYL